MTETKHRFAVLVLAVLIAAALAAFAVAPSLLSSDNGPEVAAKAGGVIASNASNVDTALILDNGAEEY